MVACPVPCSAALSSSDSIFGLFFHFKVEKRYSLYGIFFSVYGLEDAVVYLAVCVHILLKILAEVAHQTGNRDMWTAKNLLWAQTSGHKDGESRWIKTYQILSVLLCFLYCMFLTNHCNPPFVSCCRIFSPVIKEQGKKKSNITIVKSQLLDNWPLVYNRCISALVRLRCIGSPSGAVLQFTLVVRAARCQTGGVARPARSGSN